MRSEVIVPEPRRGHPWLSLACAFLCAFQASVTRAQLAEQTGPIEGRAALNAPGQGYRDGDAWIAVERVGRPLGGLTPVLLRTGTQTFPAHIDGHAVVQLARGAGLDEVLRRERLSLVRALSKATRLYLVAANSGGEDGVQLANRLMSAQGVAQAVPDLHLARVRQGITIPPNDPEYGGQWYLKRLGIEKAWQLSSGDAATKVVVIDDGCDLKHPDLRDKFEGGLDVVDHDDDPSYQSGAKNNAHGTQCAGLVAAKTDNAIGMAGVCPECQLYCVRLLPESGKAVPVSADIEAFDFALERGASVVSNSWGFETATPAPGPLRTILEELYDNGRDGLGTLVVFAAGNENRKLSATEVASVRGVMTVGAINNFDEAAPFSNSGASLSVTAPAGTFTTDISGSEGLDPGDYTSSFGGTSSACPVVAGIAGLVMSARKDMTAREVGELLEQTARKAPFAEPDSSGHDATYGYGIVDPAAALRKALGVTEPDSASDAGGAAGEKSSGGCRVTGSGSAGGALTWVLLAISLWRSRRARRW